MINNAIEERAEKLLLDANAFLLPTNPNLCAQFLKVTVIPVDLEDNISGFLAVNANLSQVGFNKNQSKERQRFTIAHELGHYILHSKLDPLFIDKEEENKVTILYRDDNSSSGEYYKEREANSFAAALLMPKKLIEQEVTNSPNKKDLSKLISELAKKFEVSKQAMNIRLSRLGYFDYNNAY
jgi:Zn-dependent peptidase ImmA (M78 family)